MTANDIEYAFSLHCQLWPSKKEVSRGINASCLYIIQAYLLKVVKISERFKCTHARPLPRVVMLFTHTTVLMTVNTLKMYTNACSHIYFIIIHVCNFLLFFCSLKNARIFTAQ